MPEWWLHQQKGACDISHFTVLVVGEDVKAQLAPYDENLRVEPYHDYEENPWFADKAAEAGIDPTDLRALADWANAEWPEEGGDPHYDVDEKGLYTMSTYSQKSKWDWYSVGGRWSGFFKVKGNAVGAGVGQPGVAGNQAPSGTADFINKGDIDFEGMESTAREEATKLYDKYEAAVAGTEPARTWDELLKEAKAADAFDIGKVREIYHAQPRIKAVAKVFGRIDYFDFDQDELQEKGRERYLDYMAASAWVPFAMVKDGEWYEKGKMGLWAMVSDPVPKEAWVAEIRGIILDLPDDTKLTLVDAHI
jgi:hypothetical protein